MLLQTAVEWVTGALHTEALHTEGLHTWGDPVVGLGLVEISAVREQRLYS